MPNGRESAHFSEETFKTGDDGLVKVYRVHGTIIPGTVRILTYESGVQFVYRVRKVMDGVITFDHLMTRSGTTDNELATLPSRFGPYTDDVGSFVKFTAGAVTRYIGPPMNNSPIQ